MKGFIELEPNIQAVWKTGLQFGFGYVDFE